MKGSVDRKDIALGAALVALLLASTSCRRASLRGVHSTGPAPGHASLNRSVSSRHLGTMATGRRTIRIKPGDLVTIQLVEPEAYASGPDGTPPPSAFPWLAPHSPDQAGLMPVAVCKHPPWIISLPARLYPFRAVRPGRYHLLAGLNPAYHLPHLTPPLPPLDPVSVTVVVS